MFTTPGIAVPGERDWSIDQHPTDGIWNKYSQDSEVGTIFWVGVGIDKMTLFELAKEGKGLSGLELGFYYNSEFVVPYVGGSVDGTTVGTYNCDDPAGYKQVLSENIATTNSTSSFGAWEGTTRTPGHNLMEMFSFEGDLNIFTGRNEGEVTYKATLDLPNSSAANNAILSDPFGNSVSGATPVGSREITGLPNGVKMTLDITADSSVQGIVIEIKPLHPETTGTVLYSPAVTPVVPGRYTFDMPADDVTRRRSGQYGRDAGRG